MPAKVILWDFDGTLAYRAGRWSGAVLTVLDRADPGHAHRLEDIRPLLRAGFPWHLADAPHGVIDDPVAWWARLFPVLEGAFVGLGYSEDQASAWAPLVRAAYLDPAAWKVYDDTREALGVLSAAGWAHVIVSNHVPELSGLVAALGMADHFAAVVTSGLVGADKPHPAIFESALEAAGRPAEAWMIGDSLAVDVDGAESAGIPAILVRTEGDAPRRFATALEAARAIAGGLARR